MRIELLVGLHTTLRTNFGMFLKYIIKKLGQYSIDHSGDLLKILKINNIKYNSVFAGYKMVMGEYEDDDDDKWERNKN